MVTVPVLSRISVSTSPRRSRNRVFLIRMPSRAAAASAAVMAAGLASTSAQGQLTTRMATARRRSCVRASTAPAIKRTTGR